MMISTISQSISDLLSNDALVSEYSFTICTDALIQLTSLYPNSSSSDSSIHSVVNALSSILGIKYAKHIPGLSQNISLSFDLILAARQAVAQPGEKTSIIAPNIRLLVQKGSAYELTGINMLAPQTAEDVMSNQQPTALEIILLSNYQRMTLPLPNPVAKMKVNKRGLRLALKEIGNTNENLARGWSSTSMNPGDIISLSVLQTNVNYRKSNVNSCTIRVNAAILSRDLSMGVLMKITIPNFDIVHYDFVPSKNGSYYCVTSEDFKPYEVLANCTSSPAWALTCPGNVTATLKYACPIRRDVPQCLGWSTNSDSYASTRSCSVTTYGAFNTTCECAGNAAYEVHNSSFYDASAVTDDLAVSKITEVFGYWNSFVLLTKPDNQKTKQYSVSSYISCLSEAAS